MHCGGRSYVPDFVSRVDREVLLQCKVEMRYIIKDRGISELSTKI